MSTHNPVNDDVQYPVEDDENNSPDAKDIGTEQEYDFADEINGTRVGADVWFDVEGPDGQIWEVKTCEKWRKSQRRGRFRLFKDQHENLLDHAGKYCFRLRDGREVVAEKRLTADEVEQIINVADYQWAGSGHDARGPHIKLTATYIFPGEYPNARFEPPADYPA